VKDSSPLSPNQKSKKIIPQFSVGIGQKWLIILVQIGSPPLGSGKIILCKQDNRIT